MTQQADPISALRCPCCDGTNVRNWGDDIPERKSWSDDKGRTHWCIDCECDWNQYKRTQLQAELDGVRQDAARYRWLRDGQMPDIQRDTIMRLSPSAFEAVIDAALSTQGEER